MISRFNQIRHLPKNAPAIRMDMGHASPANGAGHGRVGPMNPDVTILASILADWIEPAPNVPAVYLFGSRVRGDHRPDSGVDVQVFLNKWHDLKEIDMRWWGQRMRPTSSPLRPACPVRSRFIVSRGMRRTPPFWKGVKPRASLSAARHLRLDTTAQKIRQAAEGPATQGAIMFKKKVVFIIGAGASADYGMPLGGTLAKTIAADAGLEFDRSILTKGDADLYQTLRSQLSADKANKCIAAGPRLGRPAAKPYRVTMRHRPAFKFVE
jgi:hypothetical protein